MKKIDEKKNSFQMRCKIIRIKAVDEENKPYALKQKIDLTPFTTPCEGINLNFVSVVCAAPAVFLATPNICAVAPLCCMQQPKMNSVKM